MQALSEWRFAVSHPRWWGAAPRALEHARSGVVEIYALQLICESDAGRRNVSPAAGMFRRPQKISLDIFAEPGKIASNTSFDVSHASAASP